MVVLIATDGDYSNAMYLMLLTKPTYLFLCIEEVVNYGFMDDRLPVLLQEYIAWLIYQE